MTERASRNLRVGVAAALTVASAVCFLRYSWWAACYSGWYGLPKYAAEIKVAEHLAQLFFWTTTLLQVATMMVCFSFITLHETDLSAGPKFLARLGLSCAIAISGLVVLSFLINRLAMHVL